MSADEISIAEAVKLGAARITGARPTEKAAPVTEEAEKAVETDETEKAIPEAFQKKDEEEEGEDKKEKETEKSVEVAGTLIVSTPLWEQPEFVAVLERAVEKALAPVLAGLTTVEKSLGTVDSKVDSTLAHQAASTDVLVNLAREQGEIRETAKSLAAEVEVIGNQPAGRKSIDTRETEKAAPVEEKKPELPSEEFLGKLRTVTKSMEVNDGLLVMRLAKRGQVDEALSRLNAKQRAQLAR